MTHVINNVLIGLNNVGRVFCDYAAGVFVQSALLVILLLVIDLLLRKRVRAIFRYCLWMLVLVKLVLPPMLSLPTGIGYWVGDRLPAAFPISNQAFDVVGLERTSPSGEMPQVRPTRDIAENEPSIMLADSALTPLTWQAVLFILWLVGVFAFLVVLVQRIRFVRGLIAVSSPAKKELLGLLEQCRRKIGVRRDIRLRISDTIPSPAVCGFFRPTVLIPATLVEKLSPEGLRATLIHELAHIKRGDLWVNSVQTFLQVIYFYNPFVWFANAVIRRVCEEAVDETVLVTLGDQAKNYSNTLIDIGEMAFWRADLGLRLIGVTESKKALQWRIRHMLTRPIPKSSKLGALGIIVIFTIAAVLLPMARAQKPGEDNKPAAAVSEGKSTKSLHQAAADGDIGQVKSLISKGADVNAKSGRWGWTPLHMAARHGHKDVSEVLILNGADVNAKAKPGQTPLLYAARYGQKDVAELLIDKGAEVNAKSGLDGTPLYCAAAGGHKEVAELLLAKGADADAALRSAAWQGHLNATKFLLTKGANVNATNNKGRTPLHEAAWYCRKDMAELLIAEGADVNAKDNDGATPAYIATTLAIMFDKQQIVDMVNLLLAKGARIDIHLAAFIGDVEKVNDFLEQGIDVDSKANFGQTPLCLAALSGQKEVVRFLIGKGADVNANAGLSSKAALGYNPLHFAVMYPDYDVVKLLIDNGADVNAKGPPFNTSPLLVPLMAAETRGADVFQGSGLDIGFSDKEFELAMEETVGARGVQYTRRIWPNLRDVVELLLDRGADVNEKGLGGRVLLLHRVANAGIKDAVELFIAHGADVNAKDKWGWTPLHYACWKNHKDVAEFLFVKGADLNAKEEEGKTPLEVAKEEGHKEIVELLRKHGAKE